MFWNNIITLLKYCKIKILDNTPFIGIKKLELDLDDTTRSELVIYVAPDYRNFKDGKKIRYQSTHGLENMIGDNRFYLLYYLFYSSFTTGNKTFDKMVLNEVEEFMTNLVENYNLKGK